MRDIYYCDMEPELPTIHLTLSSPPGYRPPSPPTSPLSTLSQPTISNIPEKSNPTNPKPDLSMTEFITFQFHSTWIRALLLCAHLVTQNCSLFSVFV